MLNYAPLPQGTDRSFRDKFVSLGFDPLQLIAFLRRRLELLLAVTVLVFVGVLLYAMQLTPRYTATAQVLIDTRQKPTACGVDQHQLLLDPDREREDRAVERGPRPPAVAIPVCPAGDRLHACPRPRRLESLALGISSASARSRTSAMT